MVSVKDDKTPSGGDLTCYNVEWTPSDTNDSPLDCFDNYKDVFWYGGSEVYYQQWPLGAVDQFQYKMQRSEHNMQNICRILTYRGTRSDCNIF